MKCPYRKKTVKHGWVEQATSVPVSREIVSEIFEECLAKECPLYDKTFGSCERAEVEKRGGRG